MESDRTLAEARRLSNQLLRSKIIDYVVNRQNEDGGYTFCQGAESNAQDTYYGLEMLSLLNSPFPNVEKTAAFIKEIRLNNIYSIYHVAKTSLLLGLGITEELREQAFLTINLGRFFGSPDVFSEVSSEFTTTCMALELADLLKVNVEASKVAEWLVSFRNDDGGFGTHGQSNINSTYYAVASLSLIGRNMKNPVETVKFVRSCEKRHGGFTVVPINFAPYMEHTYYGVMTLDLLGEKSLYPQQTTEWILRCQNRNGGFARSDLGISTFRDTFYAVASLQKIEKSGDAMTK
jgi:hypothetical protein